MHQTTSAVAISMLFALVALACATAWIGAGGRIARGEPLAPYTPRRPAPWGFVEVFAIGLGYILLDILIAGVIGDQVHVGNDASAAIHAEDLAATALTNVAAVIWAVVLLVIRNRATTSDLGLSRGSFLTDVRLGAIAFAAVSVPIYGLQFVLIKLVAPSRHPIVDVLELSGSSLTMLWITLIAVVVAPVTEEFLFRVVIQGWLEGWESRRSGLALTMHPSAQAPTSDPAAAIDGVSPPVESGNPHQAPTSLPQQAIVACNGLNDKPGRGFGGLPAGIIPIAATSALFALLHYGHGPDPIPIFFLSLSLGYLYQRTHRVLPGIVLHMCLNGVSMLLFFLGGGG